MTITIKADRPALDIVRGESTTRWEYDVLTLKLEAERLEGVHGLKDGDRIKPPTVEFLTDFKAFLESNGLPDCSIDLSLRVYSLVTVQFRQMALSIAKQVAEL